MIKRIILLTTICFLTFQSTYAVEEIYWQPTFLAISQGSSTNWTIDDNSFIYWNSITANQFCLDLWGSYISHNTISWNTSTTAWFDDSSLLWSEWTHSLIIDDITCDITQINIWGWTSNMMWTWSVILVNFDSINWDYAVNIPTLMFIISYLICLLIAFSFLYFTTVFLWWEWKNTSKKY